MSALNRNPERWEELVADDALVGLSEDERAELASLVGVDIVLAEGALFDRAAGEFAAAAFASDGEREGLPAALATKLRAVLPASPPKVRATDFRTAAPTSPPHAITHARRSSPLPWMLAAAAIVVAIVGWSRKPVVPVAHPTPVGEERATLLATQGTVKSDFSPTKDAAATNASGDVVWHSGLQHGFMRLHGLAPNDPKVSQYQLWIFDAERGDTYPVDGGVFDVVPNERGEAIVPIHPKLLVGKAKLFAITVEQPGGVVVSKRERIVLTATSS